MKMKLSGKVFCIIGLTLLIGFSVLGAAALWLSITSTQKMQIDASLQNAAIIRQTVEDFMLKNESAQVVRYIEELKSKKIVLDVSIYNGEGKAAGGSTPNQQVLDTFKNGKGVSVLRRTRMA